MRMTLTDLPGGWSALCGLVAVLGIKHGFDADHLACIDGLTRYNHQRRQSFAPYCGALFSIGHGLIVIAIALVVRAARQQCSLPAWLEVTGAWISIGFLIAIGVLNLRAVFRSPSSEAVALIGLKTSFFVGLTQASRPFAVMLVGAAFAISFDTVSQAALFALASARFGSFWHTVTLASLFALGMVLADALNGLWVSRMTTRAEQTALAASRVMSVAIGSVSLLVAGIGIAALVSPSIAAWNEWRTLQVGMTVFAMVTTAYVLARLIPFARLAICTVLRRLPTRHPRLITNLEQRNLTAAHTAWRTRKRLLRGA